MKLASHKYTGSEIDVLEDLQHLRLRPAMYVGGVDSDGVFHIFKEVLDNSLDEYLGGHAKKISIEINTQAKKPFICVRDDGRGIPVDVHKKTGESTLITVLTNLQAGGKFRKEVYATSAGLHGIGIKATNALSSWLEATVWRENKAHFVRFHDGGKYDKKEGVTRLRARDSELANGTEMRFWPDSAIFKKAELDLKKVERHLETIVYLCPGVTIHYKCNGEKKTFKCDKDSGLADFLVKKAKEGEDELLSAPVCFVNKEDTITVALCWTENTEDTESYFSWVNLSPTPEHGTHVTGAARAIGKALQDCVPAKVSVTPNQLRSGLYLAVSVKVSEPSFKGQTKQALGNSDEDKRVYEFLLPLLEKYFAREKKLAREIIDRAVKMRDAQEQFKKLKKVINKVNKDSKSSRGILPGKLIECPDCPPDERQLFLIEGDSAAGTSIQARDPSCQEVLPLKGKIINAQRAKVSEVLQSEEVQSIIKAVGIGIDPTGKGNHDFSKLRIGKLMIMCDSDFDGHHISTLILSFLMNFGRKLLEDGRVFSVQTPLFCGTTVKGAKFYGDTLKEIEKASGIKADKLQVSRIKGLGELDSNELRIYGMAPKTRKLIKLSIKESSYKKFASYMGDDSNARKILLGIT